METKYRVWDIQNKRMLGVDCIIFNDGIPFEVWTELERNQLFNFKDSQENQFVLLQYINLKDNNDKEIYQGDILSIENKEPFYHVEWIDCWANFALDNESAMDRIEFSELTDIFNDTKCSSLKVIGNIYENPNILAI